MPCLFQTMKFSLRAAVYGLLLATATARSGAQNLVLNGSFTGVTPAATAPPSGTPPPVFGQFGPDTAANPATGTPASPASGATLTVPNWTTGGYNFVFAPGTVDSGTKTGGANANQTNEAPGQYNVGGFGSTYLWGSNNGGLSTVPAIPGPANSNFIAADGAFEQGSINQTINGLTLGAIYGVTFSWAAGQQQGYDGDTKSQWRVNLGSAPLTTASTAYQATTLLTVPSHTLSAWMTQTFYFAASDTTQTLSFLANGTPNGLPPFSLLTNVSLYAAPEPSAWAIFVGVGAACTCIGVVRRRRQLSATRPD